MKLVTFLLAILSLSLFNCGGDDGNGGNTPQTPKKASNPWAGVGTGSLTQEVSERVRELAFDDGVTVGYDGSAENGSEQVCRRQQSEDIWYEVCTSLEDDPYFVMIPNSALVWNPLMYDRFATELICRSWTDPMSVTSETCDSAFFEKMGGEGFSCQAGPVNGDKALVCSDHWAVAVNGQEEDTKTVCRVHTELGSGRCLGARRPGMESDDDLLLKMQQTLWSGYGSVRDNPEQFAPGDVGQLIAPQDTPSGARLSYASANESVCAVEDSGTVMISAGATAPTTCKIFLTVRASGYADRVIFVELPILKSHDVTWANYFRTNNYFYPGESLASGAVSSSDPAGTQNAYESLDESICTVDAESGEVTAVASGECAIRLTASAEGYLDRIIDKTIPVDAQGEFADQGWSIQWADFPVNAVVGTNTDPLASPVVVDGDDAPVPGSQVTIASAERRFCTYDAESASIVYWDIGECVIVVTARAGREYAPLVQKFRVTPEEGSFTLTWTGYAGNNAATFGSNAPTLNSPQISPFLYDITYSYTAEGDACEVDETSGALSILGAGSCEVTLTASRSGYGEDRVSHTVTIAKKAQSAPTAPDNPYGGVLSLAEGESIDIINTPKGGIGSRQYSTTDETVCTVGGDGTVMGVGAGSCTVQIAWSGDDNNAPTSAQNLLAALPIVASGSDAAAALTQDAYGASPDLKVGATLAVSTAPTPGTGQAGAAQYRSGTPKVCSVDLSTGAITGTTVGDCRIQVRFVGSATVAASDWSGDYTLAVGKGDVPDFASPYGFVQLPIGSRVELQVDLSPYGRATFSVTALSPCTVDKDGTVTPTADALFEHECIILVTFESNKNYNAKDETRFAIVSLTHGTQVVTYSEPYGAEPSLRMGEALALVTGSEPVSDQGGSISYRSADTAICTVISATGAVTPVAPGECVVQVKAAAVSNYSATGWIDIATVEVEEGILPLNWSPQRWGRVGTNLALTAVDTGSLSGVTVTYSVENAGDTGCALSGTTLAFTGTGACVVTATASKTHYEDWSREHAIRIRPMAITVTPGEFTSGATLQVGDSTPKTPVAYSSLAPSDATASWQLVRGEKDCELVSATTGAVRARAVSFENGAPTCSVQVVAKKQGYETVKSSPVSIPLSEGTIGDVAIRYGTGATNFLRLKGSADMTPPPMKENGLAVSIKGITFVGTDSSDAVKENVCEVDTQTGRATALEEAVAGDKCVVTFTLAALGYADKTKVVTLPLVSEELVFENTPPTLSYSGNLQIGVDTPLAATATRPPNDESSTPVTWKYLAEGNCLVSNSGDLTLSGDAAAGDTCTVRAVASADGYVDYSVELAEVTVDAGTLTFTSADKPTYTGTLHVGGTLAPTVSATSADDNNIEVSWENWKVEGFDSADPPVSKDGVCSIETGGRVSAGAGAAANDVCKVYVTATAPDYADLELEIVSLTVTATGSLGAITPPDYDDGTLVIRGYPIPVIDPPTAANGNNISWSYSAVAKRDSNVHEATEEICSVDAQSGAVTVGSEAMIGDVCEITVTASAAGYTSDSTTLELPVHDTFVSLDWPTFTVGGEVGETIDLSGTKGPVSVPVADDYAVSVASGNCTYNSTNHTLVLSDTTPCVLSVTASKDNYIDFTETFSVTASLGSITVAGWGSFNAVVVGAATNAPAIGATTPTGVSKVYGLGNDSEGCTVTPTGAVTGTRAGTDNCIVVLVVSKQHYENTEHIYTLSVGKGDQFAPTGWSNPYGASPTLAVGSDPLPLVQGAAPTNSGHGNLEYQVRPSDTLHCGVNSGTGAVSPKRVGGTSTCRIEARFVGDANYNPSSWGAVANVSIIRGTIQIAGSDTAAKWGAYTTVAVGAASATDAPAIGTTTPATRKTYSSLTQSVCSVDSAGAVTGSTTGNCRIQLSLSVTGYDNLTHIYSFTVNPGTITIAGWGGSYSGVKVDGTGTAPTLGVITPAGVTKAYTSQTTGVCTVNASGVVTGVDDATCRIKLVLSKAHYTDLPHTYTFTVAKGDIIVVGSDAAAKWGSYTSSLKVGGSATAPAIGTITPSAGVAKAYSLNQNSTGCTVNTGTGLVRGSAAGTDNCKIDLTLSKTNYNDLSHTYTFSVALGDQTLTWTPGAATIQHTQELVLAAVGGADASSATITYAVTSAGATGCDFKGTSGVNARTLEFDAAGTCQVTASATRSEYNPWSRSHSITVTNNPPVGITWSGYPNSNRVAYGGGTVSPSTPTYDPVGASGTYSHSGSACSVTSDGTLTPSAVGTCQVTLSATATNRETGTVSVTVTVEQGSQSAPAASNIYGNSPSLVTGGTLAKTGSLSGGHGTLSYRTPSNTICEVDSASGTITALRDGDCAVEAKWGGDTNYETSSWGTIQTVTIGLGTLTIDDPGSFTGNLVVGGAALTPSSPSTTPTGATLSYALKTNEADCTLDSTTGATQGTVSAASVAVTAGTTACTIVLTATKTGYSPATREISVNLEAASLVFANPPIYEGEGFYTDGTTPVGITHLPTQDDNGVAVAWSFAVAGSRGDNSQANVCSVDNTAGSATWGDITSDTAVADGDLCTITLTGTTTTNGYRTYSQQFTLEAGVVSILELSGGQDYYCVRMSGGRVKCWGKNFNGGLGLGEPTTGGTMMERWVPIFPSSTSELSGSKNWLLGDITDSAPL